ncbi:pisatin demethylase [Dothidotthia symphoricarpi CBS 119687]|uniref:Pisatin demethylase n=1 Tax=Dothidotthia symphoricarpi CBS 119687 TaxID=1392245 RepID=A0A6A6AR00_9PLEO|nr:pisatin demethylase [Dothidotthia symphoricarpi CBS 119687]KAF2133633.1 pisatin demethylase [Dothidotthia symphoricarpi CBS 119687]
MIGDIVGSFSLFTIVAGCVIVLAVRLLYNKYGTGLQHVPGPFLAGFTDFYRLFVTWGRRPQQWHIRLHQQYGDLVRLGPRTVSCASNKAAKKIYALNAGFIKSDFYLVQQTLSNGVALKTLFTSTDEAFHAKLRRAVNNAYAMTSLVQFEPLVDSTTSEFLAQMEERYANRKDSSGIVDFGEWLQFYAFDVICELTFSKRMGFVDRGEDVGNIISSLEWTLRYAAVIGQIPILDRFFLKNPVRRWMSSQGLIRASPVAEFAKERIAESKAKPKGAVDSTAVDSISRRDLLSRFQEAHKKDPDFIDQGRVLALTAANMIAGSDTTAISLRAIFYNLIRNPDKLAKLRAEFDDAESKGAFWHGDPLVRWNDVRDLPYLSAVINESLRTHPAVGLPLERITPAGGLQICDTVLPPGSNVGCNAWVLHRDTALWGADADSWRPERWIEASEAKKSEMKNSMFAFGAGARTCIGKNISYLEMYKLVPAVLHSFDIELAYPEKEWTLCNAWFVKQSDFFVKLRSRT